MKRAANVLSLEEAGEEFLEIPAWGLLARGPGDVDIYIRQGDRHVLFARSLERFTSRHMRLLEDRGTSRAYIRRESLSACRRSLRRGLPSVLADEEVELSTRAAIFHHHCLEIVTSLIKERLPQGLSNKHYGIFLDFVGKSLELVSDAAGLRRMAAVMSHDYDIYSHSLHAFVYACLIMKSLGMPAREITLAGAGALLHDAGKEAIDLAILQKPGPLDAGEWRRVREHPELGLALCRSLPLSRITADVIVMHHERMDGSGYPRGLMAGDIPPYVRALSLADAYDALTSNRPYAPAVTPFEALRIMRDEMRGAFDMDLYARFVLLLSGADIL